MTRARTSPKAGFTIIEVLIALVIFSLAAIVLGAAYMNVLNAYDVATRSNENTADVDFARSQLLNQADLQTAETGASFDTTDNHHVTWSATIDPVDGATDLFTVTFTCEVDYPEQPQPTKVSETFMLCRPTWTTDQATEAQSRQNAASRVAQAQGRAPSS